MEKKIKWWQKAVAYQVYPRSFYDSNGDGIGDLRGVIEKLEYLKELGIDLLYLNPVFASPMKDNGYDVSDYYRIDPAYGTNEDMYELLARAGELGIRVMMDMVVNHCSDQHEWFQRALADPEGEYGDYFYFRKGEGNQPPNNWRSIFGGSAWERIPDSDYYYLHLFTREQVDLNWENPRLREEIYRMMNFWMEKGVSGFRMDATAYMKKKEGLPSFPADAPDGLVSVKHGTLNQPGLERYLREMRDRTYGRGGCFAVGEMEDADVRSMQDYISLEDGYFNGIFEMAHLNLGRKGPNYFWYEEEEWTADELRDRWLGSQQVICPKNWIANFIECHDMPRSQDWLLPEEGRNLYGASMLAAMYLLLWGTPFIYQGQELGMRNFPLGDIGDYDDCSTHNQYEIARSQGLSHEEALRCVRKWSRDNARYPMLWTPGENGGFTSGHPWLPVPPEHKTVNVETESKDPKSLLSFYKKLIALKKKEDLWEVLAVGRVEPTFLEYSGIFSYRRVGEERKVLVICNNQKEEARIACAGGELLLTNYDKVDRTETELRLLPWQAVILEERI